MGVLYYSIEIQTHQIFFGVVSCWKPKKQKLLCKICVPLPIKAYSFYNMKTKLVVVDIN